MQIGRHVWGKTSAQTEKISNLQVSGKSLRAWLSPKKAFSSVRQFFFNYRFSSLMGRIVAINMLGLFCLVAGIMFLNRFQAGLIESKVNSLQVQGEIIARALATSASVNLNNEIIQDPEQYLEMRTINLGQNELGTYEFAISPPKAATILTQLVKPTGDRARIYDREGELLIDSDAVYLRGHISSVANKSSTQKRERHWIARSIAWLLSWIPSMQPPRYEEVGKGNGQFYDEVKLALEKGQKGFRARTNDEGELLLSVAVPIRYEQAQLGVLFLNTPGGEIDKIVDAERIAILRVMLFVAGVSVFLSWLMAGQIASPIRQLSAAANRVSRSVKNRQELPDLTKRSDEIGVLSGALREMTDSLFNRLESIERFAADVAHELKNPLTSMGSAFEVLPYIKDEAAKEELRATIRHDLDRMNRLITDISDASRADAEMARQERALIEVVPFLERISETLHSLHHDTREVSVIFKAAAHSRGKDGFPLQVQGHEDRLGQVMTNLVENAISFSPDAGKVRVKLRKLDDEMIEIAVEDEGPGIPPEHIEKIFRRFYTDRPEDQGFGNNSGLGLNISEQIVKAHGGKIWAENLTVADEIDPETSEPLRKGARFVVTLPTASPQDKNSRSDRFRRSGKKRFESRRRYESISEE